MPFASPRLRSLALPLAFATLLPACGDDDGTETGASATASDTSPTSSTTDSDPSSTGATTTAASSGSTAADSTSADSSADTTTGPAGDPTYPPIEDGTCPGGTVTVMLPGAELCAPFCGDAGDTCPMAATGDAPAECTPFVGKDGSGDACDEVTPCPKGEACDDGSCGTVAFWACQLRCDQDQTCPEGMECSGIGTCGYP